MAVFFFAVWLISFPLLLRFVNGALLRFVRAEEPTRQELRRLENTVEEMKVAAVMRDPQWSRFLRPIAFFACRAIDGEAGVGLGWRQEVDGNADSCTG